MKPFCFVVFVALVSTSSIYATDTINSLDEALSSIVAHRQGDPTDRLVEIEQMVLTIPPEAGKLRQAVEQRLIAALGQVVTHDAQRFLCGQLKPIATEASIPILERMTLVPAVSHMARFTLGSVESPKALEALHRALQRTSSDSQIGIMNTLVDRGYKPIKPTLIKLLANSSDKKIVGSTARGLGRLGGHDAVTALRSARDRTVVDESVRWQLNNALLNAAERAVTEGDHRLASSIYQEFRSAVQPVQIRLAAFRGMLRLDPITAQETLADAIRHNDDETGVAISLLNCVPSPTATAAFAALLPELSAENKVLLIRALGHRGDRRATSAVQAQVTDDNHPEVRRAALVTLARLGTGDSLDILLRVADRGSEADRRIARTSLIRLRGDQINERMVQMLTDMSAPRVEVMKSLAHRRAVEAVPSLLKTARNPNETIRSAALRALGRLATSDDIPALVNLATNSAAKYDEVDDAISRTIARLDDKLAIVNWIAGRFPDASIKERATLLGMLSKTGTQNGLNIVKTALRAPNRNIRTAAIRSLANWPDVLALQDLLAIVKNSPSDEYKRLALEGSLRLAGKSDDATKILANLLTDVQTSDFKKRILSELGLLRSDSTEALRLAISYVDNGPLQATAGLAALRIANEVRRRDEAEARAALEKVISTVKNDDVRGRAQEVINEIDRFDDHILQWLGAGPYSERGKEGSVIYKTVFAPENTPPDQIEWKLVTGQQWSIDLERFFGGFDHCAAYLRTRVWSPSDQPARLEMGSDDGTKAWVNGEIVYDRWERSGILPRQYRADIQLREGWNDVMLKVVDHGGGWSFCCRIRKPIGTALDGLRYEVP